MKLNFSLQKYDRGNLTTIPSGEFATRFIDLSQVASVVNRRFYRQGLNWAVSHFKVTTPKDCSVIIQKLPNTWVMSNAWEKSFRAWQKMNKEALAENPSVKPKFLDFKVFADQYHHQMGIAGNLLPITIQYDTLNQSTTTTTATAGEWVYSKVVVPETTTATGAATEYELIAVGPNNSGAGDSGLDAKSLIEGYAASRGLPNVLDPNTPDDANVYAQNWMMAMFNDGTLQDNVVIEDMITENNQAPYPYEGDGTATDTQYPGGANQMPGLEIHEFSTVTGTTVGGMTILPGGNFPCGLIAISIDNTSDTAIAPSLEITLVPGNHRGYLAESMTEM